MAVKLPSDLVSDVMQNADPARRKAAVARLDSLGGGARFAAALEDVQSPVPISGAASKLPHLVLSGSPGIARQQNGAETAFRGFERMVLRNLFESILPDEGSGSFGGGPSAGIWRSMAADQFAGVCAEGGGIGLADLFTSAGMEAPPRAEGQWPYFAVKPLAAPTEKG